MSSLSRWGTSSLWPPVNREGPQIAACRAEPTSIRSLLPKPLARLAGDGMVLPTLIDTVPVFAHAVSSYCVTVICPAACIPFHCWPSISKWLGRSVSVDVVTLNVAVCGPPI
jgi:hypothetical protein